MKQPLTAAEVQRLLGIDDETLGRLADYLALLGRWQRRINLVGPSTLADPWRRHILDCGQLKPLIPPGAADLFDLGSGAGLPGLVLAILGVGGVTLVDSDQRKCAFLREAARLTAAPVRILNQRIEGLAPAVADIVTARALKPLAALLPLAAPLLRPGGRLLLLKGAGLDAELTAVRAAWTMRVDRRPSLSDPAGVIVQLTDIEARRC